MLTLGVHSESRTEPFFNHRVGTVPNLLTMTRYKCYVIVSIPCYSNLLLGLNLQPPDDFTQKHLLTKSLSTALCLLAGHETLEEDRRIYRLKHSDYNNKDEVNSSNILSNKN